MVIFPHTHSKYRSLESRINWQNDRTNTEQLERRLPLLHYCISHRKLLFFLFFLNRHPSDRDPRRPACSSCRERGGGGDSAVLPRTEPGLSIPDVLCSLLGDSHWVLVQDLLSLVGNCIKKKKKKNPTYTGTHVKMRESNNPTERKCRCSHKIFYV